MSVWTILALDFTPLQIVTDCLPLMLFDSYRQVASGSVDLAIFDSSTLWLTIEIHRYVNSNTDHSMWRFPLIEACRDITRQHIIAEVECPGRNPC